jgi:3-dehydroquinate synthase
MSETIAVALGSRSYDIHVGTGLLERAGTLLAPFARGVVPVVTDENVARFHLETLLRALRDKGIEAQSIVVPPGEGTKSFAWLEKLSSELLRLNVERNGLIVAFGGGVIGDLVGFAAGVLKRGVSFAQIPTTLLAQVDSSVGGKTAIDVPEGKNLIGIFHQPTVVLADVSLLATLPRRELLADYAEVVKYAALGDAEFFGWLETNGAAALDRDRPRLAHIVTHCCRMKAAIVARDERESGERALLNLGHTFGHALEAATNYSGTLLHGEAVSMGMVLAFRLSERLGLVTAQDTERLVRHLEQSGLPTRLAQIDGYTSDARQLLQFMRRDKKAEGGKLRLVLARGIGQAFITDNVSPEAVQAVLSE